MNIPNRLTNSGVWDYHEYRRRRKSEAATHAKRRQVKKLRQWLRGELQERIDEFENPEPWEDEEETRQYYEDMLAYEDGAWGDILTDVYGEDDPLDYDDSYDPPWYEIEAENSPEWERLRAIEHLESALSYMRQAGSRNGFRGIQATIDELREAE